MANLSFKLTVDGEDVKVRELSIDVFSTFDIQDFGTADPLVFETNSPIKIFPRTRQISVVVRADAPAGLGWKLEISFNKKPVPEQPLKASAGSSGRANFDGTVSWLEELSATSIRTLSETVTINELLSLREIIPGNSIRDFIVNASKQNTSISRSGRRE